MLKNTIKYEIGFERYEHRPTVRLYLISKLKDENRYCIDVILSLPDLEILKDEISSFFYYLERNQIISNEMLKNFIDKYLDRLSVFFINGQDENILLDISISLNSYIIKEERILPSKASS